MQKLSIAEGDLLWGLAAAVRARWDAKAPSKGWAGTSKLVFRVGNDEYAASDKWEYIDNVKTRCVVLTKRIGKYTGGTQRINWFIPFANLAQMKVEVVGWKTEEK